MNKSPFTKEILELAMPTKFKMPLIEAYQGWRNPREHLETYVMTM